MSGLQTVVHSDTLDSMVTSSNKLVVMFSAPWCGPCKMIKPKVEQMASVQSSDHTQFAYVNVEEFEDTNNKYKRFVQGLPTFFVYKDGLINDSFTGANLARLQGVVA